MPKTYVAGKDACAEDSIAVMKNSLEQADFFLEEVSWFNPLPNVWSVCLQDSQCSVLSVNGKGTSRLAALASGYGEFCERLCTGLFFSDYYLPKKNFLFCKEEQWVKTEIKSIKRSLVTADLWKFYNYGKKIKSDVLLDYNSDDMEHICSIPFRRIGDSKAVFFPVNILNNLYLSNGMAAGNNLYEARVQAISEILERYVKRTIIHDRLSLPVVNENILSSSKIISKIISDFRKKGINLFVKDASLGIGFPVVCVGATLEKMSGVHLSFGAHPRIEVAIERALSELLQGQTHINEAVFQAPSFDDFLVEDEQNLEDHYINSSGVVSWDFFKDKPDYDFNEWRVFESTIDEFNWLLDFIHDKGFDIYEFDCSFFNVAVCRIVIPGLSEVYPTDDILWKNINVGKRLRALIFNIPNISIDDANEMITAFEDFPFSDKMIISDLVGIDCEKELSVDSPLMVTVGELKLHLALMIKDYKNALICVKWVLQECCISDEKISLYRCLDVMLSFYGDKKRDLNNYKNCINMFWDVKTVDLCYKIINGDISFFGFSSLGRLLMQEWKASSILHSYQKFQKI